MGHGERAPSVRPSARVSRPAQNPNLFSSFSRRERFPFCCKSEKNTVRSHVLRAYAFGCTPVASHSSLTLQPHTHTCLCLCRPASLSALSHGQRIHHRLHPHLPLLLLLLLLDERRVPIAMKKRRWSRQTSTQPGTLISLADAPESRKGVDCVFACFVSLLLLHPPSLSFLITFVPSAFPLTLSILCSHPLHSLPPTLLFTDAALQEQCESLLRHIPDHLHLLLLSLLTSALSPLHSHPRQCLFSNARPSSLCPHPTPMTLTPISPSS